MDPLRKAGNVSCMARPKKNKKKAYRAKYRPYRAVKMKLVEMRDPFGSAPVAIRQKLVREAAAKARETFETEYPRLIDWFETYDPLYVLSYCLYYFMSSEQGVDKEAIDGQLDFAPHHLELLQAFSLMRSRVGSAVPLKAQALELKETMKRVSDSLGFAQLFDLPESASEAESKKRFVIGEMRSQTFAIRNWAFPGQTFGNLKELFTGSLSDVIAKEYGGVIVPQLIDALIVLANETNERLNAHLDKLRPVFNAGGFDQVYREYRKSFGGLEDDTEAMREVFTVKCRCDLKTFKTLLMAHSDLFLSDIFTFTTDELASAYGDEEHRAGLLRAFQRWSYRFEDLSRWDPHYFLFGNPVWERPFIRVAEKSFFWVLGGVLPHTLQAMLEALIPESALQRYSGARSAYLEDATEKLLRKAFPTGELFRGSQWRPVDGADTQYENDILLVVDSTAIVVECKSHRIDAPARRGAEFRLIDTLEDVVVSASDQAQRFTDFLQNNRGVHWLSTRRGAVNKIDTSRFVRFIPVAVTYENLGFVSANLKNAVEAGLIEPGHSLVPSICLTDLETIFDVLESQAQRIHYLARRSEVEKTMRYHGDEMDLLAFYLETGFNIGEAESGGVFLGLAMKSKELDPYFVARADGISVPKPTLRLTAWWRDIILRVEEVEGEFWTELAYMFLSIGFPEQQKFEREFLKLSDKQEQGRLSDKHNWMELLSGTLAKSQYAVVGYPYETEDLEERNAMMRHMAASVEEKMSVVGIAVMGIDLRAINYPYNVLAYIAGHADGGLEVARLLAAKSPGP